MTEPSTSLSTTSPPRDTHPHWLGFPPSPTAAHVTLGVVLTALGVAGVVGNSLVLFVFTRFRRLRGPFSAFIVNLALADLMTSVLHMMVAASSFNGSWLFGQFGCQSYAFGVGLSGMNSIVTLTAIAIERYMVITAKPLSANWRVTRLGAQKMIVAIWIYCLFLTVPPLLGWSRYIQEGFLTSCSWDYVTRTPLNRAYYLYLLTLGFFVPVTIIAYCYIFIMAAIVVHGREMRAIEATSGGSQVACSYHTTGVAQVVHTARSTKIANTFRSAYIIIMLVILFVVSWTPYAVVTLIAQFGDLTLIDPWAATMPALFAKASVVYNPIVYGLSHPHFRSTVKQYMNTACRTGVTIGVVLVLDRHPCDTMVRWRPPQPQDYVGHVRRSISGPPRGEVYGANSAHVHEMCCFRGRSCCVTQTQAATQANRHCRVHRVQNCHEII